MASLRQLPGKWVRLKKAGVLKMGVASFLNTPSKRRHNYVCQGRPLDPEASDSATSASNAYSTYPTISGAPSGDGITVQLRARPSEHPRVGGEQVWSPPRPLKNPKCVVFCSNSTQSRRGPLVDAIHMNFNVRQSCRVFQQLKFLAKWSDVDLIKSSAALMDS